MTGRSLRQLPLRSGGLAHQARHTLKYYVGHPRPRSLKSVLVLLPQILGPFGPPNKRVYFDIFKKNSKVRSGGLAHQARHTLKYYVGHPRPRSLKSVLVLLPQILGPFGPPKKRVNFCIFKITSKVRILYFDLLIT